MISQTLATGAVVAILLAAPAPAQLNQSTPTSRNAVTELEDGSILAHDIQGTYLFADWDEYLASSFFTRNGKRCGIGALNMPPSVAFIGSQSDCTNSVTVPDPGYDPSGAGANVYDIPVVFHVLYSNNGTGNIPDARIFEQVAILNADFAALTNSKIQFHLATVDPSGNPTSGITRHRNKNWYNDRGSYASSIGWDTTRYLNIYTNTAGGNLGYAYLPNGGGVVGSDFDGVRLLWRAVGYTNYSPYDLGRTGTHEVGHYLGLQHTFQGGCGTSNCYASGDLCCDTNPESSPNYSACSPTERATCGSPDPVRNFMDYSEDACMDHFTLDQSLRMRCTLENWRVNLTTWENGGGGGGGTAPDQVSGGSPSNGATEVAASTTLSWGAANGASQYDVYFGTSTNPSLVSADQSGTSYDPGTLADGTTYYWRVDSENSNGVTAGSTWSFTTAAGGGGGGGGGGGVIFSDGFESGSFANWSRQNNDARISTNALTGTYAADLRKSTGITTSVSTSQTEVTVSWAWRTSGYDNGERIQATITGGAGGAQVVTYSSTSWASPSVTLTGVSGTIGITFDTNANRKNERAYVDDVLVQ